MDMTSRALESLVGSSQRTEALLAEGLAALQQVAEGLGDVRGLLLERLPERPPPSRTPPAVAVGQRVRVRSDVEEPVFGWGAATNGVIGTVRRVTAVDGTCLIDFPRLSKLWWSKLDELEVVVPDLLEDEIYEGAEEEGKEEDNGANRIAGLVQLLGPQSSSVEQADAANELGCMAHGDAQKKTAIAAAGAIPALVQLLHDCDGSVRSSSCWAVTECAAGALGSLAAGHAQNQTAIADAGAIPALVKLLDKDVDICADICVQKEAAFTLSSLAHEHVQNQTTIVAAGAIPALMELLGSRAYAAQAARALGSLAASHAQNQTVIADAGAIPALVELLGSAWDDSPDVQEAASAALDSLSAGHMQNLAAVVDATAAAKEEELAATLQVGKRVRVRRDCFEPAYEWGEVDHDSVGVVVRMDDDGHCLVDLPDVKGWHAMMEEMQVVVDGEEGTEGEEERQGEEKMEGEELSGGNGKDDGEKGDAA
ncbi:hypothetical protein FOA52_014503 [Chlamydomonas sp. UWO 241]|nr:hypothetical protein FOA52_014503 [Chlamydomonas sp. UWO 241]